MPLGIIFIGELVEIEGISLKGKNRIREHGVIWKCRRVLDNGRIMLESTDGKENFRWVESQNDPDFRLVKIVDLHLDAIMDQLTKNGE